MVTTEQVVELFIEVADTLVDDFDVIDFLHTVAEHAATLSGAASVGVLLADDRDVLVHLAASSAEAQHLELLQQRSAEGPCQDCYRSQRPVVVTDLGASRERWPEFVQQATEAGICAVHAFPLRLRERTIGTLNVFGETHEPLPGDTARVLQALADLATIAILQERTISAATVLTGQLQTALHSRVVLEQAKGIVAQSRRLSVDDAFMLLRDHSRSNRRRLTDVARGVVMGVVDPAELESEAGQSSER